MRVTFTKVDGKRYRLAIEREHGPALVPRFAPGYDDLMPHDLAHYVVEEQFEIELGVFGQLAAGGRGIFKPAPSDDSVRYQRTAQRIATIGRSDMARSEQLVVLAVAEWERSIGREKHSAVISSARSSPSSCRQRFSGWVTRLGAGAHSSSALRSRSNGPDG